MRGRLTGVVVSSGAGLLHSNRTGYILVDPKGGRLDTYDTKSKRTGWGTIHRESGTVEVFDKEGKRIGSGLLPPRVQR
jgi:hypothetical protein